MISISNTNEAWVLHREDLYTSQEGHCNVYCLLDVCSQFCLALKVCDNNAKIEAGGWPKQIFIAKNDPCVPTLKLITESLNIRTNDVPYKDLKKMVKPLSESFHYELKVRFLMSQCEHRRGATFTAGSCSA